MSDIDNLPAPSILSLFQTTKEERQSFVSSVMQEIKEGNKNPLDIHLQVKCMEELAAQLKDNHEYKKELLEATTKQLGGAKSAMFHNAEFSVKEVGTKYDFTNCNDSVLIRLATVFAEAKKKMEERQDFLKKVPVSGMEIRDDDELITIYPPVKTSTTSVAVSLK